MAPEAQLSTSAPGAALSEWGTVASMESVANKSLWRESGFPIWESGCIPQEKLLGAGGNIYRI